MSKSGRAKVSIEKQLARQKRAARLLKLRSYLEAADKEWAEREIARANNKCK